MKAVQALITIGIIALCTLLTRALPFWVFPVNKPTPKWVAYLGSVLPYAIIGMLIVYCLKDTALGSAPYGLPEALGVGAVAGLYLWRKNALLAIAGGTVLYMVLVQWFFAA